MKISQAEHLPLVAAFLERMGLASAVNAVVPTEMEVDVGTVVSFMVLDTLYMAPFFDPALQRPQLSAPELSRVSAIQSIKQRLRGRVRVFSEPVEDFRPYFPERVFARTPVPGRFLAFAMCWTHLTGLP